MWPGPCDEDITSLDMTILMACKQKVNQSYIMIIVATFDELMLRHDVCSLSFSEIHTWIKKSARHNMEGMEDQRSWLGTKSKCSSGPPPGHHVTLGPKIERDQVQHVLEAGFGLQKSIDLWWTPRSHTDSDWGVQVLHENLIKSTFQRIWPHIHIFSKSATIVYCQPGCFLPTMLRHRILAQWAVYQVESIMDVS